MIKGWRWNLSSFEGCLISFLAFSGNCPRRTFFIITEKCENLFFRKIKFKKRQFILNRFFAFVPFAVDKVGRVNWLCRENIILQFLTDDFREICEFSIFLTIFFTLYLSCRPGLMDRILIMILKRHSPS